MSKTALALSGGVDSAVAGYLLREAGNELLAVTMITAAYQQSDHFLAPAARVATWLGIPHSVVDARAEFDKAVVAPFVAEYAAGRTPNPCVACNQTIKWRLLLEWAVARGCSHLATGHYARTVTDGRRWWIERGKAGAKEQSYFLARLEQEQIAATVFPLHAHTKREVTDVAEDLTIPHAAGESQEICFIRGSYAAFVEKRWPQPLPPGEIVDLDGRVMGRHRGLHHYTVGQRGGLGVAAPRRLYVVALQAAGNRVVVGPREACHATRATVDNLSWMAIEEPVERFTCRVQIRYRHRPVTATIVPSGDRVDVVFDAPEAAVAPGQTVVFYDRDRILGCGRLLSTA
ncbi:tRNA 2-thiouridine(34) synthase MnmA [bacterium]|nr:tRNA 2-thiouridine(34) synthase MnmA [candidate division CSSED10-310 bacterium]